MATISKLTVCELKNESGVNPVVVPWSPAASEYPLASAARIVGVAATDSSLDEGVALVMRGIVRGCSPGGEAWAVRDPLWAASGGGATKTRPAAPLPQVQIGNVFQDEGAGTFAVLVNIRVMPSPLDLSGVAIEALADKDVLIYESATSLFRPRQIDHGLHLAGLADDDHTQYLKEKASGGTAAEVPEHNHDAAASGGVLNHRRLLYALRGF